MKPKIRYVININTAVVCFRTSATDENPIIFRKIDDDTANSILHNKVKASDVIEALMKHEASKDGFSWREYDRKRQAAEKLLNVSQREMVPVNDDAVNAEDGGDEGSEDVVSLKDLGLVGGDKKPSGKENTSAKKGNGSKGGKTTENNEPPEDKGGADAGDDGGKSAGVDGVNY